MDNAVGNLRMNSMPLRVPRTRRRQPHRIMTSLPAGRMVPIAAVPLLREDSLLGQFNLTFEMNETVEVLMNAVNVRVMAYVVPKLALERFSGMDAINKSYMGEPLISGQPVTPWVLTEVAGTHGTWNAIHKYLGKHTKAGDVVSTEFVEAYNQIWNFRAKNRSPKLTLRSLTDKTLAPAFWMHQQFSHIVPDFDQALIEGEVALQLVNSKMPVKGIGFPGSAAGAPGSLTFRESDGATPTYAYGQSVVGIEGPGGTGTYLAVKAKSATTTGGYYTPDIYAELAAGGVTMSLANIDLARKTAAFARMRQQYNQLPEEYLIDLLMDGITISDQHLQQPILLFDDYTTFGMSKRYASDASNLTKSVVNGVTMLSMRLRVPRLGCGGVVMIMAEVTPDQLFERQRDPYLYTTDPEKLPQYLRDELDPEKVEYVANGDIDVNHSTPSGVFGYQPLNAKWLGGQPHVGGRYYRPTTDGAFDEVRQRIWAVETSNPTLGPNFYIASDVNLKPFVVQNVDPFDCLAVGETIIEGNTVFGPALRETSVDYAEVVEEGGSPDQIDKTLTVIP